jgi:MFS family permease
MKKWGVLSILAASMFIIVIDTTIMNVSISALVVDLNTTVSGVQAAISLYALVMASFMLTGGKLADYVGRKKTFVVGLVLFGIGTTTASFSTSLGMLVIGWSVIEGLGSALMMPNIQTILRSSYSGKDRAFSYGIIGAVGAVGAALGPILGGFLTTYYSWRWAFRLELLIVVLVLSFIHIVKKDSVQRSLKKFDYLGTVLSATGMTLIVLGLLLIQSYGLVVAKQPLQIANFSIAPFGLSVVPFLMGAGVLVLVYLFSWESNRIKSKKDALFNPTIFAQKGFLPGVNTRFVQMAITAGVLFIFPLFLQMTFDYSAMKTGVALLPFSLATLLFAIGGAKFSDKYSAKTLIKVGFILCLIGLCGLTLFVNSNGVGSGVAVSTVFVGAGVGFIASQIVNLVLSTVGDNQIPEASGLNGTMEQLGNSFGVAMVGTVLMVTLVSGFTQDVTNSTTFTPDQKQQLITTLETSAQVVSNSSLEQYLESNNVPSEDINEIITINTSARLTAFKASILFMVFLTLLSLLVTKNLPDKKLA